MCSYAKNTPEANFAQMCLEDSAMAPAGGKMFLTLDGMAGVTWADGESALYEFSNPQAKGGYAKMVRFNGKAVTWTRKSGRNKYGTPTTTWVRNTA